MTRSISAGKVSFAFPIPKSPRKQRGSERHHILPAESNACRRRLFRVIGDCGEELAGGAIVMAEDEGYPAPLPLLPRWRVNLAQSDD